MTPKKAKKLVDARRGAGRVGFLASRQVISDQVEAGHPLTTIYESIYIKGKAEPTISYSQFARYVAKFIRGETDDKPSAVKKPSREPGRAAGGDSTAGVKPPATRDGAGPRAASSGPRSPEDGFAFDPKGKGEDIY